MISNSRGFRSARPTMLFAAAWIAAVSHAAFGEDGLGTQREISDMIPEHHESTQTARDNNWGILPEFGYSPDQKLNGGIKFTGRKLTDYDLTFDGELNAALGKQLGIDATLLAPHLLNHQAIQMDEYHYYLSPNKEFFGLGNNHLRSPISVHTIERTRALITFAHHLSPDFVIALSGGPRETHITQSGAVTDALPSTLSAFSRLVGIHGGRTSPIIASFIYNGRESITHPTRGGSVIGSVECVSSNLSNDFNFMRYSLDASYLHPLWSRDQVLGLHANGEAISGYSRNIPFFEMPSLGGADSMRGFFPDRFLGRSRLVTNAEYRGRMSRFNFRSIWDVQIDGAIFADIGRVFISDGELADTFRVRRSRIASVFEEFRYSYGTGLRIALGEALVARIDVGFSNEQTGLVYLVFGHMF